MARALGHESMSIFPRRPPVKPTMASYVFMQQELEALRAANKQKDEELAQCHKRLRLLGAREGSAHVIDSSSILAIVAGRSLIPYPKDQRPAFKGLRYFPNEPRFLVNGMPETNQEYVHRMGKKISELHWCRMLGRVRATCRGALAFHGSKMQLYLQESQLRLAAGTFRDFLYSFREHVMTFRRYPPGCPLYLEPYHQIGESWVTLEADWPGMGRALRDAENALVEEDLEAAWPGTAIALRDAEVAFLDDDMHSESGSEA